MISSEEINNIILQVFPNYEKKDILLDTISDILFALQIHFFDGNGDLLNTTLKYNNYRNLKAIIISLFYYIKPENFLKFKNFKNLTELNMTNIFREFLYVEMKTDISSFARTDNLIDIDDMVYLQNIKMLLITSIIKMSNKLFVNWINIQPISSDEVIETDNFITTLQSYKTHNYSDDIDNYIKSDKNVPYKHINRLYIGEIYNVIRNFFYERMKMNKLMIFYYVKNNKLISYYKTLVKYFNLNPESNIFTEVIDYRMLPLHSQNKFSEFALYLSGLTYINDENKSFSEDDMKLYFGVYYFLQIPVTKIKEKDKSLYKELKRELYNTDDDDASELKVFVKKLDNDKLNQLYSVYINNDIYIHEFFKFIQKQIIGFKSTVFSFQDIIDEYQPKIFYNFFKNWLIKETNPLELLSQNYEHLTKLQKQNFIEQFNNLDLVVFNINRIERKSNGLINKTVYIDFLKRDNFIEMIYESLIREGILSKIVGNTSCIEKSALGEDNIFLKRNMREKVFTPQNISKFNKCYHFFGNTPYKNIKIPQYDIKRDLTIYEHLSHKDYSLEPSYYSQYALNWVSQIFLYFKYLNCRVLYITGATGVGKSTQIPKLLTYALKAFSYKISGKVICTQPRIDPTVGIAETVSRELAMPIVSDYDGTKILEPSMNKYVQYEYKKDKIVDNYTQTYLKFSTDGLFLQQLLNNIVLKEESQVSLKMNEKNQNKYKINNLYDIIAIDEAHEHNKNMDYILTLMRNTLYYNNDLKLVIISATMEDDEKYYRYYYRHINDNLKFPLSSIVLDPWKVPGIPDNNFYSRYLIDRRVHIAAPPEPGLSDTKFPIQDIYLSEETDYDLAEKESIKTIQKICDESINGHVLLFTTGKAEIISISRILANKLPRNVFIFPYFAEMPNAEKYKEDVKKIEYRLKDYKFDRLSFINFMAKEIKENQMITTNIEYTRAIIIATNVAEASITIPNLQFVVDIGYYNFVGYDYNSRLPIIQKNPIDENSRKQRRGRTGRMNAGTVYYMYKEGARKNVITVKSIESSNITFDYLKFISDNVNETTFFNEENDPYYIKLINPNKTNNEILESFRNRKGYDKIIKTQFFYENNLLTPDNIHFRNKFLKKNIGNNKNETIFKNMLKTDFKIFHSYKETGFEEYLLFDNYGIFFIIHPEESNIQRINTYLIQNYRENIDSPMIQFTSNTSDIKFKKIDTIFNNLVNFFFLEKGTKLFSYKKTKLITFFNLVIGSKLDFMVDKVTNSIEKLAIVYLYSKIFNITDDILLIINLLKCCPGFNIRSLFDSQIIKNARNGKLQQVFSVEKYKLNIDYNYEILHLLKISKQIIKFMIPLVNKEFKKLNYYVDLLNLNNINVNLTKDYNLSDITSLSYKYNINKYILSVDQRLIFNKIIKESNDKELETFEFIKNNITAILDKFYIENKSIIRNIAIYIGISPNIIPLFINNYINNSLYNFFDKKIKENIDTDLVSEKTFSIKKNDGIMNSFYHAFKLNIDVLDDSIKNAIRTKSGFIDIGIASNAPYLYLNKALIDIKKNGKPEEIYSIINRLNFFILDLKKEYYNLNL